MDTGRFEGTYIPPEAVSLLEKLDLMSEREQKEIERLVVRRYVQRIANEYRQHLEDLPPWPSRLPTPRVSVTPSCTDSEGDTVSVWWGVGRHDYVSHTQTPFSSEYEFGDDEAVESWGEYQIGRAHV